MIDMATGTATSRRVALPFAFLLSCTIWVDAFVAPSPSHPLHLSFLHEKRHEQTHGRITFQLASRFSSRSDDDDENDKVDGSSPFKHTIESFLSNSGISTAGPENGDAMEPRMRLGPIDRRPLSSGRASLLLQAETVLAPVSEVLQEKTGGWALSYANLTPESEQTVVGQTFLATNVAYAVVGLVLSSQGETFLAFLLEMVSVASFAYHYAQLAEPYNRTQDSTVKLALMLDYALAFASIGLGLLYLLADQTLPPIEGIASSIIGIACLLACWKWERGLPYIGFHSLWHIFSALSAYYVGTTHLAA